MIDLTIAICTIRDPSNYLIPTLDEIQRTSKLGYSYEILVYGPQYIQVPHPTNPIYFTEYFKHGNIYGYNLLAHKARGRNIVFLTDDMIVPENLFEIVKFLDYNNDKFNIAGFRMHDGQDHSPFPNRLILPNLGFCPISTARIIESVEKRYGYEYTHQPIPLIRFITASKETIDILLRGYLFHPSFKNGGGDQYLSIFAWYYGQRLLEKLPCTLYKRDDSPSVLDNLEIDGETLRDLVSQLTTKESYV